MHPSAICTKCASAPRLLEVTHSVLSSVVCISTNVHGMCTPLHARMHPRCVHTCSGVCLMSREAEAPCGAGEKPRCPPIDIPGHLVSSGGLTCKFDCTVLASSRPGLGVGNAALSRAVCVSRTKKARQAAPGCCETSISPSAQAGCRMHACTAQVVTVTTPAHTAEILPSH